ncbi:uncharacterized transporter slc-17.2-like isoform X2 [Planococcus citri]|uniref:uncharacterized transporter slc-17.2-like isoform X2 n=1 Tax=Planococcus citri TaxID=170843 RepID=UPI0031F99B12
MNARSTLWLLVFLGFWINDVFKTNMSMVITSMVKDYSMNTNFTGRCGVGSFTSWHKLTGVVPPKSVIKQITFDWDDHEQDLILGSFFWIHWIAQLPGGILTHYFGTKGATWSSLPHLTARWIPKKERAIFLTSYLGGSAGWPITYVLSMYITDTFGWQYVFYVQSILGMIWCITWKQLAYDDPFQHPSISIKERAHILNGMRESGFIEGQMLPIPWRSIFTCAAVWVNLITCTGSLWVLFTMITLSPSYLKSSHGLDWKTISIFFSISHIARWFFAITLCSVAKRQKYLPLRNVRKLATSVCTIGTGSTLLIVSLSNCNIVPAMIALSLAIISIGVQGAGPVAIFIDMGPNFTGILTGISGSVGGLAGLISPMWLNYLMKDDHTSFQWQKIFMITAFICWISGIVNLFFGTSELQSWNKKDTSEEQHLSTQITLLSSKSNKTRVEMISCK